MSKGPARRTPDRIHLLAHANPATRDLSRFGLADMTAYLDLIRHHVPGHWRVTFTRALLEAHEDENRGGRRDDAARARDINDALRDPRTRAIIALNGGAWFSRILADIDLSPLAARRTPMHVLGFSEMTSLVNLVASYRAGRGVYWLCPNYLTWKLRPAPRAQAAFGEFWRRLDEWINEPRWRAPKGGQEAGGRGSRRAAGSGEGAVGKRTLARARLDAGAADQRDATDSIVPDREHPSFFDGLWPIEGRVVSGRCATGRIRIAGGCLSVLAALTGPPARRMQTAGRWLLIEDINEQPYRIDRHLAALKLAGRLARLAGVLVGDFRNDGSDQSAAVVELLRFHLPAGVPVVSVPRAGHVWPMSPVPINRGLTMRVQGPMVAIGD